MNSEFTCAQCRDALPGYVAGTLAHTARPLVERHLAVCDTCQHECAQWRALAKLAHQADAQTSEASAQSASGTWAAIQARIVSESPFTTGVHSVNDSQHDSSPIQGATSVASPPHTHTRPSLAHRRIPVGATGTVAALLLVVIAVGLFAFHSRGGSTIARIGRQGGVGIVDYTASDALSPTDVWAVGIDRGNGASTTVWGVISHFDGKQWHIDESAAFVDTRLYGISMDSATDGWAVGFHATSKASGGELEVPFFAHYTRGHWVPQTLNLPGTWVKQVQMFGPDAGWATGFGSDGGPAILHYQHGVWTQTTFAPTPAALTQAASTPGVPTAPASPTVSTDSRVDVGQTQFLSDREGWATGSDKTGLDVWQYHNGQWQTALHLPGAPDAYFLGLGANSSTDAWVLGTAGVSQTFSPAKLASHPLSSSSSGGPLVLLHFDGHTWTSMPYNNSATVPFAGDVNRPFLDGATWLAKYGVVNQKQLVLGLLLNQGDGHWSATTFPKPMNYVLSAHTAPDGSTLAVADLGEVTDSQSESQTLQLLRYADGKWSNV